MLRDPKMYPSSTASAVNLHACVTLGLNTQPVFHEGRYLSEKRKIKLRGTRHPAAFLTTTVPVRPTMRWPLRTRGTISVSGGE